MGNAVYLANSVLVAVGFYDVCNIDGGYLRTHLQQNLGKASRSASGLQHGHSRQACPELLSQTAEQAVPGDGAFRVRIELGLPILFPLDPEMVGIATGFHETGNTAGRGNSMPRGAA